jgi:5,10-methylene-tetrahydrofolate dehydrogenase/methenyl tetrahydrofolate cyclohydrolase
MVKDDAVIIDVGITRVPDESRERGYYITGDVDFDAIKKALTEINYDGYVTAEMIPYVHGRPEKTAAAMKKIFK